MIFRINNHDVNFDDLYEIFKNRLELITVNSEFLKRRFDDRLGYYLYDIEINPYNFNNRNCLISESCDNLGFLFNFSPREIVRITKIINDRFSKIKAIRVLKDWGPHLDLHRSGEVLNLVLYGDKSSTIFYDKNVSETLRTVGRNFYYFDPGRVIHSAEVIDEYMDIISLEK